MLNRAEAHPYPSHSNPLLYDYQDDIPEQVAVIGAGAIGPDIGYFFKYNLPSVELVLVDIDERALEEAEARIENLVEKAVEYNKIRESQQDQIQNIQYTTDYSALAGSDLVIEAVSEDLEIKHKVIEDVEAVVDDDCIITSNTSSLPAEQVFSEISNPSRTTITHFFAPAWQNPAVEIIEWDQINRPHIEYLYWLFAHLGKLPLLVEDEIAFALDRIFNNWCNESAKLLDSATAAEIDSVAEEFVAAGPFNVLNLSNGNPVIVESNTYMAEENEAYAPDQIFRSVSQWNTKGRDEETSVPDDVSAEVRDRLLGVLLSQATNIVDRGIATPADLNIGCEAGLGFQKPPLDILGEMPSEIIDEVLTGYSDVRPEMPLPDQDPEAYQDFKRDIITDELDDIVIITIRRPHRGNILSQNTFEEIQSVFEAYSEAQGFILTSYGLDAFSSGFEIGSFLDGLGDFERSKEFAKGCSGLFRHMEQMETPVVAAINGRTLGAGAELMMRCHSIVAMEDVHIQFPEVTLGILPGIGGAVVPYRRWGENAADEMHDMLRYGKKLPAVKAKELGMVEELSESYSGLISSAVDKVNKLYPQVEPLRKTLNEPADINFLEEDTDPYSEAGQPLSPEVDNILCETINMAASASTYDEALEIGYEGFARTACTSAAKIGVSAFVEGREPDLRSGRE
jgi:enoyl-CoA hydratase/3-hydroxyacyl-CoA dehydrogenase